MILIINNHLLLILKNESNYCIDILYLSKKTNFIMNFIEYIFRYLKKIYIKIQCIYI